MYFPNVDNNDCQQQYLFSLRAVHLLGLRRKDTRTRPQTTEPARRLRSVGLNIEGRGEPSWIVIESQVFQLNVTKIVDILNSL